jgi:hypothetical protein
MKNFYEWLAEDSGENKGWDTANKYARATGFYIVSRYQGEV